MKLTQIVKRNFNIEPIIKLESSENGSGNTYIIETQNNKYVAKENERIDFINVYEKVQSTLNSMNLRQSRIIRTNEGLVMTSEGVVLYEFIEGNNYKKLNQKQSENCVKFIRQYNKALKLVPFKKEELDVKNHWDKARSIDFIVNEFPLYLAEIDISNEDKKNVYAAICILSKNKEKFSALRKQLIHSDLGADNFIFKDDDIASVIDFTPEYHHEIYSLCQFIYWNYLWDSQSISIDELNSFLRVYDIDGGINCDESIFCLLLINVGLYRIVGPLLDKYNHNRRDFNVLEKRFFILNEILAQLT